MHLLNILQDLIILVNMKDFLETTQIQLSLEKACTKISSRESQPPIGMSRTKPQILTGDPLGTTAPATTGKTLPQHCCTHEDLLFGELELKNRMGTGILAPKPQDKSSMYLTLTFFFFFWDKNQHSSQIWEATSCVQCIPVWPWRLEPRSLKKRQQPSGKWGTSKQLYCDLLYVFLSRLFLIKHIKYQYRYLLLPNTSAAIAH